MGHHGTLTPGSVDTELRLMREQLGLMHLQLQYERHRREVHAVRNRRLLGESRSNKALDEHNSALVSCSIFFFNADLKVIFLYPMKDKLNNSP